MARDVAEDAVERYEQAVARAALVRAAWEEAGMPLVTTSVRSRDFPHPLFVLLAESERDAERFAKALGPSRVKGGRPKAASSAPDRTGRLRAV